jgi:hypothetical protein
MIEKETSFGDRTVAWHLDFNKNTVQRRSASALSASGPASKLCHLSQRPRTNAPSRRFNHRLPCSGTDRCRVWSGRDA